MAHRNPGPASTDAMPDALDRFDLADWLNPDEQVPERYAATSADAGLYRHIQARHRWTEARERWAAGGRP